MRRLTGISLELWVLFLCGADAWADGDLLAGIDLRVGTDWALDHRLRSAGNTDPAGSLYPEQVDLVPAESERIRGWPKLGGASPSKEPGKSWRGRAYPRVNA
jgi:hypothetical protein